MKNESRMGIHDPYHTSIIAEIGVNHNGSVKIAKKLILSAKIITSVAFCILV